MELQIKSSFRIATVFTAIGFIMTLGMVVGILINPEGGQFHSAINPEKIISELSSILDSDLKLRLLGIIFDTFFIVGYLAIFYGLYLYTKESDALFPKIGFIFGFLTGFCDILENAVHIALFSGVPNGWNPEQLLFVFLWLFTFVKDLSSYMAFFIFMVLLIFTRNKPKNLRNIKLVMTIFIGLYVVLGSIGVVIPIFLYIRNISFVLDLAIVTILFYKTSNTDIE